MAVRFDDNSMVVGSEESEEMENADNGNECLKKIFIVKNSLKEENQFKKEGLTPLILKAFESKHMNVKHKHREKM
ncbi:hypothetical protein HpKG59_10830 [Helicobacter pylori]